METPAGPIIYPRGLDSTALDLAYRINSAYLLDTSEVLANKSNKWIPTIIQNQSAFPEGYATTMPWRLELYLTPPQNMFMGASIWRDGLTTHEYRHAQQFVAYNKEFTYLYKRLIGNTEWLLSTVLNVPLWYREGDAVDAETRFTHGGRGNLPAFNMEYRTLRLNGIKYSYEKAMSASNFRDFVPNMYRSGYYMSTRLRRDYGADSWAKVLDSSTKKFIYPFTQTLEKVTGEKAPSYYTSTFDELDIIWKTTDTVTQVIGQKISKRGKTFENYRFPQLDAEGNLIVSYISFTTIRGFYELKRDSSLNKIKTAGIYTTDHQNFVVEGRLMAWAEAAYNPRYLNKTFSIIKIKNLETGKTKQISHRSKYFSPAPSPDGQKVAVIEFNEEEKCSVKIINIKSEKIEQSFSHNNAFLAQPRWISNKEIVLIEINYDGNQLVKINTENGGWSSLLEAHDINIAKPFGYNNKVYFSSGFTGIENIFELTPETNQIKQITNARFGAFDPFVANDTLYFSNYDKNGYEVWSTPLTQSMNKTVLFPNQPVTNSLPNYYKTQAKAEIDSLITIDSTYNTFFWNKFFYAGGWFPVIFPPELGIEFNTLNLERTFKSTIGISYNFNENVTQTKFIGSYAKFFPIINGTLLRQARKLIQPLPEYSDEDLPEISTAETILGGGIEIPLNLTQGVYESRLSLRGDFNHHIVEEFESGNSNLKFNSAVASLSFARTRPRGLRQVQTPFGQIIQAHYKYGLEENDPKQLFANGQFYFPGIIKTHSLNFRAAYEKNENNIPYRYLSLYKGSRGYQYYPFDKAYLLSANYEFPILYPDKYIRAFVGVTRIRFNAFADYSVGNTSDFEQTQRSFGGEVIFDLRVLRAFNMDLKLQFAQRIDFVGEQQPFYFTIVVDYFELLR